MTTEFGYPTSNFPSRTTSCPSSQTVGRVGMKSMCRELSTTVKPYFFILEDESRKFNDKISHSHPQFLRKDPFEQKTTGRGRRKLMGFRDGHYLREIVSETPFRESMKRRRLRSGRPRPVRTLMASWTWREAMVETIPARFPNSTSTPFSGVFRGSP
jgi:hypothetical protein